MITYSSPLIIFTSEQYVVATVKLYTVVLAFTDMNSNSFNF